MPEVGANFVTVAPSARGFGRSLDSQIGGQVDSSGRTAGKKFGGALKVGALAALGAGVVAAKFLGDAVGAARESAKVAAQTNAVIKSTGGAANVTAGQVAKLAGALSAKTGIDDEVIQSGQNMLLTFKNVRNEAGKGNDIFDQATSTLIDMSTAMGTEPKQAAIQLGKALNDPIKGISALSRVGVTFTEKQKNLIQSLVDGGETAKAQKIVLGELNSEFGGSAEAAGTAGDKFRVAFGNLQEQIGGMLLPLVDKVANVLTTKVVPAVSKFIGQIQSGKGPGGAFADVMGRVGDALRTVGQFLANYVVPAVIRFAHWVKDVVVPAIIKFATSVKKGAEEALQRLGKVIQDNRPFLEALGTALRKVAEFIFSKVVPAFGRLIGWALPKIVDAIGFAIKAITKIIQAFLKMVEIGAKSFKGLFIAATWTFDKILKAAAAGLGWIPGIGPKLQKAQAAFEQFRNNVTTKLDNIAAKARQTSQALDQVARDRTSHITIVYDQQGNPHSQGGHGVSDPTPKTAAPRSPKVTVDQGRAGGSSVSGRPTVHIDTVNARDDEAVGRAIETAQRRALALAGLP